MPTIAEIRQQYPQYHDMSDQQLGDALYAKHYSDMPREQFDAKVGLTSAAAHPSATPQGKPSLMQDVSGAMANFYRGTGIGDEASAGLGTAASAIGDAVTGKQSIGDVFSTLGDRFKGRMAMQRGMEDDFAARRPIAANVSKGLGIGATMLVPAGPAAPIANATRLGNIGRGTLTAATTAAGYSLADRGTLEERGGAATAAAVNPLVLGFGAAGGALSPVAPRAPKPINPDVVTLAKAGVDKMTPGQIRGGWAKTLEDQATSLPILGPAIQDARNASIESFNSAALNRALEPIGEALPSSIKSGSVAVKYAGDRLSAAYKKVLPEGGVYADREFANSVGQLSDVVDTLTPARQAQVQKIIESRVMARLKNDNKVLSGDAWQKVDSELGMLIGRYGKSTDGDQRGMGEALQVVKDALTDAAVRQNPQFAAAKAKIDAGYAHLVRAETAASSTAAEGGIFTPKQYDIAVKAGSNTVRKRGYGRGDTLGYDLSTAGQAVLPSKLGNSGSGDRAMLGALVSAPSAAAGALVAGAPGAAAGALLGPAVGMAGLSAASRMYSESAIAAANAALSNRISAQARQSALGELEGLASKSPEAAKIYRDVIARLPRAAGIGGASAQAQQLRAQATGSR